MKINIEYDSVEKTLSVLKGGVQMSDEMDIAFYPSYESKGKYSMEIRARKYDEENKCMHVTTMYANEKGEIVEETKVETKSAVQMPDIDKTLLERIHKRLGIK